MAVVNTQVQKAEMFAIWLFFDPLPWNCRAVCCNDLLSIFNVPRFLAVTQFCCGKKICVLC